MGAHKPARKQTLTWTALAVFVIILAIYFASAMLEKPSAQALVTEPGAAPTVDNASLATAIIPGPTRTVKVASPTRSASKPSNASFDFYLLSLSWSPDYCETGGDTQSDQCSVGRKLGFVLHGLWPQNTRGYPSYCSQERLPRGLKDRFAGLYPSPSLYDHEWEKHGTCTDLTPEEYLALSKQLKESVVIPQAYRSPAQPVRVTLEQFKNEFTAANPGMEEAGLAVFCSGSGRFLSELRVCFSPDGAFMACSEEVLHDASRSCRNPDFLIRNVR
jgi:ribonuclease T2